MSDKINPGYFSAKELGGAFRAKRKALGRTQQWVADQCKFRRIAFDQIGDLFNEED